MKNAKEAEINVIFLKLRVVQELVVIEMVRREEFGKGVLKSPKKL